MGEQMSKEAASGDHGHSHSHGGGAHGHSHNGQPCHGHGNAHGHSHSHGGSDHGHSHSHGGGGHGHSHGGGHGHSHGGQPCHGHGPSDLPPVFQKRMKVAEVFLKVVLLKLLPGLFANYHTPTPEESARAAERAAARQLEKLKISGSEEGKDKPAEAPVDPFDNEDQAMTRDEFRKFVIITQCAANASYGYPVTRVQDVAMMEAQILSRARLPIHDAKADIRIPQKLFLQICAVIVRQVCVTSPESLPALMQMWGLNVAIPNLFIEPERAQLAGVMLYARDNLAAAALAFVEAKREENKDAKELHVRSGFYSLIQSFIKGIEESNSENPETKQMLAMLRMTPYAELIDEFKQDPADGDIEPKLLINKAIQTIIAPLLLEDPHAMKQVAAQWGVEMKLVEGDEEETGDGEGRDAKPAVEPGSASPAAEEAHGHSHDGKPCHGHGHSGSDE